MVPSLFANARNQHSIHIILAASLVAVGGLFVLYCPMCYIAFGDQVQYFTLLNIGSSMPSEVIKLIYIVVQVYNMGLNMYPIFDILENLLKNTQNQPEHNLF